ncbi:MAG: tyrosine-type recombinase/integrase, partial [Spirulinaceae cyanobacterium]
NPDSAARILRVSCEELGIEGVSSHSFRRTALTQMSNAGIPLRIIQEILGYRNLDELQKYLEVTTEQVRGAVSSLSMLGYVVFEFYDGLESAEGCSPSQQEKLESDYS